MPTMPKLKENSNNEPSKSIEMNFQMYVNPDAQVTIDIKTQKTVEIV